MSEYWEQPHIRGQQTIAVWNTFAPTFTVGTLTLAAHQLDVALIYTQVNDREVQQDVFDAATTARDDNYDFLRDMNVRATQVIEASLDPDDSLQAEVADVRNITALNQEGVLLRARRLISLWTAVNVKRAALVPPLPELQVGAKKVADLTAAVNGHGGLLLTMEQERAKLTQKKEALRVTVERVDQNNKRWYVAWGGNFAPGTPEHNALAQIDTEAGASQPTALEIATVTQNGTAVDVSYVAGGGHHATSLQVLYKVDGVDASFAHATPVLLAGQSLGPFAPGQTVEIETRSSNSVGAAESAVKTLTLT